KEIVKVDDLTVRFVLSKPEVAFLPDLGMDFASIVSKEYADKLVADGDLTRFSTEPVGTGPFLLVDYQLDSVIRYAAWDDYFAGREKLDDLIFVITTDAKTRAAKLQAGECDIMPYPAPADVAVLQADPNLTVLEQEGFNIGYLAYNTMVAPFDKVEVRKALNMAVDKQAIIDAVYQGAGTVAKNPLPPTIWAYDDAIQ